ncbi:MAG: asparaginase [Magnetococcales bacterium]|nr:asparaginase [Magnetococcales bacterium]
MQRRFRPAGAIDDRKDVYIVRDADKRLYDLLLQGNHCNLHAGRQGGKTSLMRKTKRRFEAQGHLCVEINLSLLFRQEYPFQEGVVSLIQNIMEALRKQIPGISVSLKRRRKDESIGSFWVRHLDAMAMAIPEGKRLFVMLDELDIVTIFPLGEVGEFFFSMREYLQGDSSGKERITFLLVSVLTPNEMLMEHNRAGMGISFFSDVALLPFENTTANHRQFAEQAFPEEHFAEISPILEKMLAMTGGQPFLTSLIGQEIQLATDISARIAELEAELMEPGRNLAQNHLQGLRIQLLSLGTRIFSVVETYKDIHGDRKADPSPWNIAPLENIGLIARDRSGRHIISNPIYRTHLTPAWADEVVASYEMQAGRQRTSLDQAKGQPVQRRFNKKLSLILVGGTMGMLTEGRVSSFAGAMGPIEEFIRKELDKLAAVEHVPLFQLDGINVTPLEWIRIAEEIHKRRDTFDGFVVAHGTDTLAYSASAVAFMLGRGFGKPVVFTGSQTTIDQVHGDTRDNFIRSCFAAVNDQALPEVQICFGDLVMRAVRAEKKDDRTYDGFQSPGWPLLARITEHFLVNGYAMDERKTAPDYIFRPYIADRILLITLAPGLRPVFYEQILERSFENPVTEKIDGILITTPGLGNIPSRGDFNFRHLIHKSVQSGIPVLIASQVPINPYTQTQYEMASVPAQYGAIPAGNLTLAAALTKFAWVIGCIQHEIKMKLIRFDDPQDYLAEVKKRMRTIHVGEEGEYGETR